MVYDASAAQSTLPARNITIRPGMTSYYAQFFDITKLPGYASATFENPRSQVGSVGVEWQIRPRTFVSVDYVKQHWTGLDRTVDLNAPTLFVRTAAGQVRTAAAAITLTYRFPLDITAGVVSQLASARPFNALTGVDNNGDGVNNDRPVINGQVVGRYAFRGTPIYDTAVFAEGRVKAPRDSLTLRMEGFNLFNSANVLGRNGTCGNADAPLSTFGQASPGLANIDPGRMLQFLVRFGF